MEIRCNKYILEISDSISAIEKDYVQCYIQHLNSKFKSINIETASENTSKIY